MLSSQTSCLVGKQHCGTETPSSKLWLSAGPSSTCESILSSQVLQESNNLDLNGGLGPGTLMLALFFRSADQAQKQTLCSLLKTSFCVIGENTHSRARPTRQPETTCLQLQISQAFFFLPILTPSKKLQQSSSVDEGLTSSQVLTFLRRSS